MQSIPGFALLLSLVVTSVPANAGPPQHWLADATQLLASCNSDTVALRAMCLGYVGAISDGIARHQTIRSSNRTVCIPADVNLEAYRNAFLEFMGKQPDAMQWQSFEAVKAAQEAKWPCPQ